LGELASPFLGFFVFFFGSFDYGREVLDYIITFFDDFLASLFLAGVLVIALGALVNSARAWLAFAFAFCFLGTVF